MQPDIGEGGNLRKQHTKTNQISSQQPPIAQHADTFVGDGDLDQARAAGQQPVDAQADQQVQRRQQDESFAPAQVFSHDPGQKAPGKTAENGSGDVQAGDFGDFDTLPALADVSHAGGEDHRDQHALDKAPEQQAVQVTGRCQHQARQAEQQRCGDQYGLLAPAPGQHADKGCDQGHGQGGRGDAPADVLGAHSETLRQLGENALGSVKRQKRGTSAEEHGEAGGGQARLHGKTRYSDEQCL
ncbi:hypothetical protein D3C79_619600 [compost metagenome]